MSKYNQGIRFLLCVSDFHSEYSWVVPLKDQKARTATDAFQKVLDE